MLDSDSCDVIGGDWDRSFKNPSKLTNLSKSKKPELIKPEK